MTTQTLALLAVFLEDPSRSRYGLDVSKQAGLASGTIYPILARLEEAGWIESEWEDIDPTVEGRRPRRYYCLTGEGEVAARQSLDQTIARLARSLRPNFGRAIQAASR